MPSFSAWNQVSFSRPGTASIFTPKAGIVQEWITSGAGDQHVHHLVHRHHHRGVGGEQVQFRRVAVRGELVLGAA